MLIAHSRLIDDVFLVLFYFYFIVGAAERTTSWAITLI